MYSQVWVCVPILSHNLANGQIVIFSKNSSEIPVANLYYLAKLWDKIDANVHIWAYVFWPHNSAIFWPIWLKIWSERTPSYHALFGFWFLYRLWPVNGRGRKMGLKTQPNCWLTGWPFMLTATSKMCLKLFRPDPPIQNSQKFLKYWRTDVEV